MRHIYHQNVKYALCNVELHMTAVVGLAVIEQMGIIFLGNLAFFF